MHLNINYKDEVINMNIFEDEKFFDYYTYEDMIEEDNRLDIFLDTIFNSIGIGILAFIMMFLDKSNAMVYMLIIISSILFITIAILFNTYFKRKKIKEIKARRKRDLTKQKKRQ